MFALPDTKYILNLKAGGAMRQERTTCFLPQRYFSAGHFLARIPYSCRLLNACRRQRLGARERSSDVIFGIDYERRHNAFPVP